MSVRESRPHEVEAAHPEALVGAESHSTEQSTGAPVGLASPETINELIARATAEYLAELDRDRPPVSADVERALLAKTNFEFGLANASRHKTNQIPLLKSLTHTQVAEVMLALHHVIRVRVPGLKDQASAPLAIYVPEGEDEGTYVTHEDYLRSVARRYNRELTISTAKEVFTVLREQAPLVAENDNRDLIAVANGIFHYGEKTLRRFKPEVVLLSKTRVRFDPMAVNPVIDTPDGDQWDVETWIQDLSDDEGVPELLWQIAGAVIRPHVRWGKSAWFYSERGNNGKGTLVELLRELAGGDGCYSNLPLSEMGKEFMLEGLLGVSAILTDENDVGTFIDRAANMKAIITNDVIHVNRKNKTPISFRFWGFMVQCLNEFPRTRDRSESLYRRQLFVPFSKWFGGDGVERAYIKDDFVHRQDVLEYVLKKVLLDLPDYYKLSEPAVTKVLLSEFKRSNDPVRDFWIEHRDAFAWDLLPFSFLYDVFKAWMREANPSGTPLGRNTFTRDLRAVVDGDSDWNDPGRPVHIGPLMDATETLIATYALTGWYAPGFQMPKSGVPDLDKMCAPALAKTYRGLVRVQAGQGGG